MSMPSIDGPTEILRPEIAPPPMGSGSIGAVAGEIGTVLKTYPGWVTALEGYLRKLPVATILLIAITVIAAIVGGVVVIVAPQTLTFAAYLADLKGLAVGLGLLALGRGYVAGQRR